MWYQITEAYLCLLLSLYKVYCNTHTHKHCTCIQLYLIGMLSASVYHLFSLRTPWGGYHATSRRWKSPSMWRAATSRWLDDGVLQRNPWVKWQIIDKSLGKIMENPTQTRWKKCATRIDQDGINDFSQYLCNIIAWFSLFQDLFWDRSHKRASPFPIQHTDRMSPWSPTKCRRWIRHATLPCRDPADSLQWPRTGIKTFKTTRQKWIKITTIHHTKICSQPFP